MSDFDNDTEVIDPPQFSSHSKRKGGFDENSYGSKTASQFSKQRPKSSYKT